MKLQQLEIADHELGSGKKLDLNLFYETFGRRIGTAPIVLINHALTGNSTVSGKDGWWQNLVGEGKTIDTNEFTILSFNVPGNGYDQNPENLLDNYKDFTARDIAEIFWKGLQLLEIEKVFAIIGGSLGGGIAWEMAALRPDALEHLIPIASDWKATDWVIGNVLVQDQILNNSDNPIHDARLHAMLLYRTPQSLGLRFNREKNHDSYEVENWLNLHGHKLQNRFRLASYKLINHLLKTVDITRNRGHFIDVASRIFAQITVVSIDSDQFYLAEENRIDVSELRPFKHDISYHEIRSVHGHDAFLIEHAQLSKILQQIFQKSFRFSR
ncbi:alpha/beta fold hydrolase [Flavobacterium sp.]|uniref:alpha/beta fold hydrolase n=1 Tax=Flavobacterium sp. TaxID=239 RepID=UPI00121DDA1C|nr:alpha/beta fold hydrolase [Flavobacterium sp.]RZJ69887.1 MAG: alpha/beta fold hydrolase [Flavobacterium sp.]